MKFFGFCWHKWKHVYLVHEKIFLGEKCPYLWLRFRICVKCGKAQEFIPATGWKTLSKCEAKILLNKIIDKGKYYVLE